MYKDIWSNGSTHCDRFIKNGECHRENCKWTHSMPENGKLAPLCKRFFENKDGCEKAQYCKLSHIPAGIYADRLQRNNFLNNPTSAKPTSNTTPTPYIAPLSHPAHSSNDGPLSQAGPTGRMDLEAGSFLGSSYNSNARAYGDDAPPGPFQKPQSFSYGFRNFDRRNCQQIWGKPAPPHYDVPCPPSSGGDWNWGRPRPVDNRNQVAQSFNAKPSGSFEGRNHSQTGQNLESQVYHGSSTSCGARRQQGPLWGCGERAVQPFRGSSVFPAGMTSQQEAQNTVRQNFGMQRANPLPYRDWRQDNLPSNHVPQASQPSDASAIQKTEIRNYQQRGQDVGVPWIWNASPNASFPNGVRGRENPNLRDGTKESSGSVENRVWRDDGASFKPLTDKQETAYRSRSHWGVENVWFGNMPNDFRSSSSCQDRIFGEGNFGVVPPSAGEHISSNSHLPIGSEYDNSKMCQTPAIDRPCGTTQRQPETKLVPESLENRRGSSDIDRVIDSDPLKKLNPASTMKSPESSLTEGQDGNVTKGHGVKRAREDETNLTSTEARRPAKPSAKTLRIPKERPKQTASVATQTDPPSDSFGTQTDLPPNSSGSQTDLPSISSGSQTDLPYDSSGTQAVSFCPSFNIEAKVSPSNFLCNGDNCKHSKPINQNQRKIIKPVASGGSHLSPSSNQTTGDTAPFCANTNHAESVSQNFAGKHTRDMEMSTYCPRAGSQSVYEQAEKPLNDELAMAKYEKVLDSSTEPARKRPAKGHCIYSSNGQNCDSNKPFSSFQESKGTINRESGSASLQGLSSVEEHTETGIPASRDAYAADEHKYSRLAISQGAGDTAFFDNRAVRANNRFENQHCRREVRPRAYAPAGDFRTHTPPFAKWDSDTPLCNPAASDRSSSTPRAPFDEGRSQNSEKTVKLDQSTDVSAMVKRESSACSSQSEADVRFSATGSIGGDDGTFSSQKAATANFEKALAEHRIPTGPAAMRDNYGYPCKEKGYFPPQRDMRNSRTDSRPAQQPLEERSGNYSRERLDAGVQNNSLQTTNDDSYLKVIRDENWSGNGIAAVTNNMRREQQPEEQQPEEQQPGRRQLEEQQESERQPEQQPEEQLEEQQPEEQRLVEQQSQEQQSEEQQLVEQQPKEEQQLVEQKPEEQPPEEQQFVEQQPEEQQLVEQQPEEQPPEEQQSVEQQPEEQPPEKQQSVEQQPEEQQPEEGQQLVEEQQQPEEQQLVEQQLEEQQPEQRQEDAFGSPERQSCGNCGRGTAIEMPKATATSLEQQSCGDGSEVTAVKIPAPGSVGAVASTETLKASPSSAQQQSCADGSPAAIETAAHANGNKLKLSSDHKDQSFPGPVPSDFAQAIECHNPSFDGALADDILEAPADSLSISSRPSSPPPLSLLSTAHSPSEPQTPPQSPFCSPQSQLSPPSPKPHLSSPFLQPQVTTACVSQSQIFGPPSPCPSDVSIGQEKNKETSPSEMPISRKKESWQTVRRVRQRETLMNSPKLVRWSHDRDIRDKANDFPWLGQASNGLSDGQLVHLKGQSQGSSQVPSSDRAGQSQNNQRSTAQRIPPSGFSSNIGFASPRAASPARMNYAAALANEVESAKKTPEEMPIQKQICWLCGCTSHLGVDCKGSMRELPEKHHKLPAISPADIGKEVEKAKPIEGKPIHTKPIEEKPIVARPIVAKLIEVKPTKIEPIREQFCWHCGSTSHMGEYCNKTHEEICHPAKPLPDIYSDWDLTTSNNSETYESDWDYLEVETAKPDNPPHKQRSPQRTTRVPKFNKMDPATRLLDTFEPPRRHSSVQRIATLDSLRPTGIDVFPTEILDNVFCYLADGIVSDESTPIKEYVNGYSFEADGLLNIERNEALRNVIKTCRRWRMIGQNLVYKVIHITNHDRLENLVRTVTQDPVLGEMVRVIRIDLKQVMPNRAWHFPGSNRYESNSPTPERTGEVFYNLMLNTPRVQVLSANMFGSTLGFEQPEGFYPMMRDLQIKDDNRQLALYKNFWRNLKRYPNIQSLKVCHVDQSTSFDSFEIHPSMLKGVFDRGYPTLTSLTFESAPEISDDILLPLVQRLPKLEKLLLLDCKLVTSGGLAQALRLIPNKLRHLAFWTWVDFRGKPTEREEQSYETEHLCDAIRECGHSLQSLNLKSFRLCGDFWKGCDFPALKFLRINMMIFRDCNINRKVGDQAHFIEELEEALDEGKMPLAKKPNFILQLRTL